jgi:hypothetical protein
VSSVVALFFVILFGLVAVGIVIYLVLIVRLLARLRVSHPAAYEALGSPSLFINNTPRNNLALLGWLYRRDYSALGDVVTVRSADTVRTLLLAIMGSFVALLVAYAVFGVSIHGAAV